MKKNILFTMLFALCALVLTSCDKKSEGLSRFTYYPTITLYGDTYLVWEKGETYVDPGYYSELNGEDVTSQVTVSGALDVNKSGVYKLTYSVMNEDGINASASRTVVVLDSKSPIEGFYMTQANSFRSYNGNDVKYGKDYEILIIDNGDGTLEVDDLFGGWYSQRAGYGANYAMWGIISLAGDGTVGLVESLIKGWGDGLDGLSGSYDAANSTFKVQAVYNKNTMFFNQTWVKE